MAKPQEFPVSDVERTLKESNVEKVYCQRNGKYDKGLGEALGTSIVDFFMFFFLDKKERKNQDAPPPCKLAPR